MGLRLVFSKKPKEKKVLCKNIMYKTVANKEWKPKTNIREIIGYEDMLPEKFATAMMHKYRNPMYKMLMTREVNPDGTPKYKTNINEIIREFEEGNSDGS